MWSLCLKPHFCLSALIFEPAYILTAPTTGHWGGSGGPSLGISVGFRQDKRTDTGSRRPPVVNTLTHQNMLTLALSEALTA